MSAPGVTTSARAVLFRVTVDVVLPARRKPQTSRVSRSASPVHLAGAINTAGHRPGGIDLADHEYGGDRAEPGPTDPPSAWPPVGHADPSRHGAP